MIFDNNSSYFFYFGILNLIIFTYQDYKNNRYVDDRKNWIMLGIAISLLTHMRRNIFYLIGLGILTGVMNKFMNKIDALGEADNNTLTWIYLGLGIISPYYLLYYLILFSLLTSIYLFFKNVVFKYEKPVQFYPVLLLSLLLFGIMFKMF